MYKNITNKSCKKEKFNLLNKNNIREKLSDGHDIRIFEFYDVDTLCSTIYADFSDRLIYVENNIENIVKTAFGNNLSPSWDNFMEFLEERCVPRERGGLREYLEAIDVCSYDPLAIVERTKGRMAEDGQWLEIKVMR